MSVLDEIVAFPREVRNDSTHLPEDGSGKLLTIASYSAYLKVFRRE